MSYDFCVGVSRFIKDNPIIVGAIEMNEYPELCAIAIVAYALHAQQELYGVAD
jgi:hypothetical protein